jgi:hypothetical protein
MTREEAEEIIDLYERWEYEVALTVLSILDSTNPENDSEETILGS